MQNSKTAYAGLRDTSIVVNFEPLENGFAVAKSEVSAARSHSKQVELSILNFFKPVEAVERKMAIPRRGSQTKRHLVV